jgi:hypothetical protein
MKEATGELNSTLVVVIAVGLLAAFFYYTLWPILKNNMDQNSMCSQAWCDSHANDDGITVKCHYKSGNEIKDITCVWKG